MLNIKIAFFDVDGTLVAFEEDAMHEAVKNALLTLQKNGIKLFLATGRPPCLVPQFPGFSFDGVLSYNGGFSYSGDTVIYQNPIPEEDVRRVVENAKKAGHEALLATEDIYGSSAYEQVLEDYMMFAGEGCHPTDEFDSLMKRNIYQIMVGVTADKDEQMLEGTSSIKSVRWWDRAVDIIPRNSGKATAIEKILEYYGFSREECIAFGDGGNDLEMIEYAGTGVAMGNGVDEVKAAADYVTDTCMDDGVVTALRHFGLL